MRSVIDKERIDLTPAKVSESHFLLSTNVLETPTLLDHINGKS